MKRAITLHLLCLSFLIIGEGTMTAQVSADGNGTGVFEPIVSNNSTTLPNFTVPAGNEALLVVFAAQSNSRIVTGITYNGSNLTFLGKSTNINGSIIEIWYLALGNVAAGGITSDVVVTVSGGAFIRSVIAASYKKVDQTTPMNNFNSVTTDFTGSASIAINSANNNIVVSSILDPDGNATAFSVNGGETQEAQPTQGNREFAASRELSAGASVDMAWLKPAIKTSLIGGNIQEATPLPVELVSFKAEESGKKVRLHWQTASETNNEGFEIQKAVGNEALEAGRWQVLAFVEGNGTTNEIQNYTYTDEHPQAGLNYYRLKQIDFDGKFEFSDIVLVDLPNFENLANLRIFPNPAPSDELTLYLPETNDTKATIRFYDQRGKLALQQTTSSQQERLNVSQLAAGMYFVEVRVGGKVFREKVVVE